MCSRGSASQPVLASASPSSTSNTAPATKRCWPAERDRPPTARPCRSGLRGSPMGGRGAGGRGGGGSGGGRGDERWREGWGSRRVGAGVSLGRLASEQRRGGAGAILAIVSRKRKEA